jgi:hypothetical protein
MPNLIHHLIGQPVLRLSFLLRKPHTFFTDPCTSLPEKTFDATLIAWQTEEGEEGRNLLSQTLLH